MSLDETWITGKLANIEELVYSQKLDVVPPTVNQLFSGFGRRFKNPKYKPVISQIKDCLDEAHLEPAWYKLRIYVCLGIYTIDGKFPGRVRKLDASNRIKCIEDEVSDAIHLNDSYFKDVHITKHQSETEFTVVEIYKIRDLPEKWEEDELEANFVRKLYEEN